jgi:uncharacterized repeat protein (TIGR03803 family)
MTNREPQRGRISRSHQTAASAVLALVVVLVLAAGAAQSAQAQTFTVLYSFTDSPDGAYPEAGLIRDAAGNFYSTTVNGGVYGYGTVFKLDTSGREIVLYSFRGGTDGAGPSGLIQDAHGNLYGTTAEGGGTGCHRGWGCGTVFEFDPRGKETILYSFTGGTDGAYPAGALFRDMQGNLYGTTELGGNLSCYSSYGCGTVFKIAKTGKETVLYSFTGEDDGSEPQGGVISDGEGNLYGTTADGGNPGWGTVFKLSKNGKETTLYDFEKETEGDYPNAGVTLDKSGTLYGTTVQGGAYGYGTAFKVDKKGEGTLLHSFLYSGDGANPFAGVILDKQGNLYGVAETGGGSGYGVVYKLDASGILTLLHIFGGPNGEYPFGVLLRDAEGNLYGTTAYGGGYGYGTVWKLTP